MTPAEDLTAVIIGTVIAIIGAFAFVLWLINRPECHKGTRVKGTAAVPAAATHDEPPWPVMAEPDPEWLTEIKPPAPPTVAHLVPAPLPHGPEWTTAEPGPAEVTFPFTFEPSPVLDRARTTLEVGTDA